MGAPISTVHRSSSGARIWCGFVTAAHGPNGGPLERVASEPFLATSDFTLYVGDVRDVLATLEHGSVDCCITSPPYWGLRDYGADGQLGLGGDPGGVRREHGGGVP
jgi:hypothetical protein